LGSGVIDPIPIQGAWRERWTPTEEHIVTHFREELATVMRAASQHLITSSSPADFSHYSQDLEPDSEEITRRARQLQDVGRGSGESCPPESWFPRGQSDPVYKLSRELSQGLESMRPTAALRLIHGARRLMDTDALRVCHAKALMDVGERYEGNRLARACTTPRTDPLVRASAWSMIAQSQEDLGGPGPATESYLRAAQLDPTSSLYALNGLLCSLQVGDLPSAAFATDILNGHAAWEDQAAFSYAAFHADSIHDGETTLSPVFHSTLSRIEGQFGPLTWHLTNEATRSN